MKHVRNLTSAVPLAALLIAGCSSAPKLPRIGSAAAAPAPARDEVAQAAALLDRGDEKAARKLLDRTLKRNPADMSARLLRDSIGGDPIVLLGRANFPYVVRPGETKRGLAERFLGNPLKFYLLARYNRISVPAALATGQLLRIPGEAPKPKPAPPPPAPERAERPEPSRPEPARTSEPAKPRAEAPAPPAAPAANPALAARMRGAGLAALTQGNVARAVLLLRRAAALDPANPLIQRDLARAERIMGTVRAKR